MEIIRASSFEQARKLAEKNAKAKKQVIIQGRDISFNRKILEMKRVNTLILNHKQARDKLKQRDSGLNHILCRIAKKNNISIAIDFQELLEEDKKQKAKILSRIKQNIKLLKKFKNKAIIINGPKDKLSISALFRVLGADTKFAKNISKSD